NNYSLSAEYVLFNGFNVVNNYRIAKNAKAMGVAETQQIEDDICLEVIQSYYNVLYYMKMSDLGKQQLQEAQANLLLTQSQESQGLKGFSDVAEMEATVAEKDYNLIKMQNNFDNAMSVLKQKMFFPLQDSLSIERDLIVKIDATGTDENISNIAENAKSYLPTILISENKIREAQLTLMTSKWKLAPQLSAYASYSTNYAQALDGSYPSDPFWDQIKSRQGQYVQLSMFIPIFSGLERQSNIRRNKNNLNIARYRYEDNMKNVEVEIELAVQDKEGAMKAFVQADKRAAAQRVAHKLNQKKYEQGLISAIELQTSSNNVLLAEAERLNAFFQYNLKYKVVQYYKGDGYLE
ncbi:MAG: TolC family protein, partial [Bacteroidales bacterium]|nr:TolC family protein [Bacteroidales bacterium]